MDLTNILNILRNILPVIFEIAGFLQQLFPWLIGGAGRRLLPLPEDE